MKRLGTAYDLRGHGHEPAQSTEAETYNCTAPQAQLRSRQSSKSGKSKRSKSQPQSGTDPAADTPGADAGAGLVTDLDTGLSADPSIASSTGSITGSGAGASVGPTTVDHPYIEKLEQLFLDWETYGHKMFDKQSENVLVFAREVRNELVQGSMAKAEQLVKYLESTSIGHEIKDLELYEKVTHGIDYLEKSVEESRLSLAIQNALANACDRLLTIDELPEPWRENPYITEGYRFSTGPLDCIRSIVDWHNETTNIWTHLLGAFLFIGLGLFHLPNTESWQKGTWIDRIPMIVFVVAALKCLFCSVTWHSFCNISHLNTKRRMACVDYTGITVCICASILTTEYSLLKCHAFAQAFYMFITLVCGVFGVILNWHPKFDSTGARPLRALFFSCFAVFGGLCGIHACFYRGVAETLSYYAPVVKSLACYGTGVLFYATLFPERFFEGSFINYCGMSHNIWHVFVVAGIYYHYKAMIEIFGTAVNEVCPI